MKKFIFLSLIILFLNKTQNVFANQSAFTVDNIIVEGKIRDNNYRDKYGCNHKRLRITQSFMCFFVNETNDNS